MANNSQKTWITESHNGRGWENSLEISSVEDLRSNLLELGASISFDDDSYGITNANGQVSEADVGQLLAQAHDAGPRPAD